MDLSDVECLDAIVAEGACERWHGSILYSGERNVEPYNLLAESPVVRFYKLQTGNVQSRQASDGIIIPTAYPATVDEWPRVLIQLEQWAFDGNSRGRSQVQITVPFFFPEDECSVIGWLCYLCVLCLLYQCSVLIFHKTTLWVLWGLSYCGKCIAYNVRKCMFCDTNSYFRTQTRKCRHWDKLITICLKYWTCCPEK